MSSLRLGCVLLASIACGDGGSISNQVCDRESAPDGCGNVCTVDRDCAAGLYCSPNGECNADCVTSADCGGDRICTERGRCINGDYQPGPDASCPTIVAKAEAQVPTVVLLIDRSGSMNDRFPDPANNASNRWKEMHRALTNLGGGNGVVDNLQGSVAFGAVLYSSDDGDQGGTVACPTLQSTPTTTLDNAAAINTLIADNAPERGADTPTAESLNATYGSFPETLTPTSPRILVLATDGDPDTCEDPNSNGDDGPKLASEYAVAAGFTLGISTYVLSVGDDAEKNHLDRMARIGVGQDADTGTATAVVAANANQLQAAFESIIGNVRNCLFDLDGVITEASSGDVRLDGTPLELGTDWQVNDGTVIELIGETCSAYLDDPDAELTATFSCGGYLVP